MDVTFTAAHDAVGEAATGAEGDGQGPEMRGTYESIVTFTG